jgi:hypothetical protein
VFELVVLDEAGVVLVQFMEQGLEGGFSDGELEPFEHEVEFEGGDVSVFVFIEACEQFF